MQMRRRVLPEQYARARCGRGEPRPNGVSAGTEDATARRTRKLRGFCEIGEIADAGQCVPGNSSLRRN